MVLHTEQKPHRGYIYIIRAPIWDNHELPDEETSSHGQNPEQGTGPHILLEKKNDQMFNSVLICGP